MSLLYLSFAVLAAGGDFAFIDEGSAVEVEASCRQAEGVAPEPLLVETLFGHC